MGIENISTGYKPEFALGALYHGFNAGNADEASQLELIKNYLANTKTMAEMPLDIEKQQLANQGAVFDNMRKSLEGNQAQEMNTPERIGMFGQAKQAGYQQEIDKSDLAALLKPFAQKQLLLEQESKTQRLGLDNQLAQIDSLLSNGGFDQYGNQATPQQMQQWAGLRKQIIDRMGETPEMSGKTAIEHIRGGYDLQKAGIMADANRDAANAGGKAAWAQAIKPATDFIVQTQHDLTRLNDKSMDEQISIKLATQGLKKGTAAYAAAEKTTKAAMRAQLERQLQEGMQYLDMVRRASGMMGPSGEAPTGQQKPIHLE